ncbi:MAG TPA: hypothetical protein VJA25_09125 [Dehalococcoidia bacterium]|nr:hypothetical protein [Dehalococcoidia bacterium]
MAYRPPIASGRPFSSPEAISRAALERRALVQALVQRLALILQVLGQDPALQPLGQGAPFPVPKEKMNLPLLMGLPRLGSTAFQLPKEKMQLPMLFPDSSPGLPTAQVGVPPGLFSWIRQPGFYESDYDPHGRRMGGPGPGLY